METAFISADLVTCHLKSLLQEDQAEEKSIVDQILFHISTSEFQKKIAGASKQVRNTEKRPDYWSSEWGKLLNDPRVYNLKSKAATRFRRRFRVNIYLFEELKMMIFLRKIFEEPHGNSIPLEFKILICLRKLGRYEVDDTSAELSYVGESTCHALFEKFVTNFSKAFLTEYVNVPTGEKLLSIMEVYRRLGLPGCIGSMDCTHIFWNMCPKELRVECTGKYGKPTLAFQAVVDHSGRCMSLSRAFYGTKNDKTIALNDTFTVDMLSGIFKDIEFPLYGADEIIYLCSGAYVLVDNGYHRWACLVPPHKFPPTRDDVLWSEWVESVRKDVECFFGKMKARWQFLKVANRSHSAKTIECAFQCCCIIHNMLLDQSTDKRENADEATELLLNALDPNLNDPTEEVWEQEEATVLDDHSPPPRDGEEASGRKRPRTLEENQAVPELTMFNFKILATARGAHFGAGYSDFDKLRRAITNNFLNHHVPKHVPSPHRL